MRSDRLLPHLVNPKLRELTPYALPELLGELDLLGVRLKEVDVHVEAATFAIGDGVGEGFIGGASCGRGWVLEGFAVGVAFAVRQSMRLTQR